MVLESLNDRAEAVVVQSHYFFIPLVHSSRRLCRGYFCVEDLAQFHSKSVGAFEYRMIFEQDIDTMTLYVSPFVLRHHQRVLAVGEYLAHGFAIGVCLLRY